MNFKQQIFCKITGWNGDIEKPSFIKIPESYFELVLTEDRISYILNIQLVTITGLRSPNMREAVEVQAMLQSVMNSYGGWIAAFCRLEEEG